MTDEREGMAGIHESLHSHVAQLRGERRNAVAYGQKDIVAAVDRQLAALGVDQRPEQESTERVPDEKSAAGEPPQSRLETARGQAPKGRTATGPKQDTSGTRG